MTWLVQLALWDDALCERPSNRPHNSTDVHPPRRVGVLEAPVLVDRDGGEPVLDCTKEERARRRESQ